MANFNDETKKEISNSQYFTEGVHYVTIEDIKAETAQDGKEFWELTVKGEGGEEGTARMYWTEKAQPYSFNTIRDIFVHNTTDKNKDAVRLQVDATNNTDELLKLSKSLVGKKAWYKVEQSGTQYLGADGTMKNSYNRNLYGYEPKMKPVTPEQLMSEMKQATPVDVAEIPFE